MAKKRIYEIAKDEGLPSSLVLQRLQRAGMAVKTASSTVDVAEALYAINPNRYPKPPERPESRKKAAEPSANGADAAPATAPLPTRRPGGRPRPSRPRPVEPAQPASTEQAAPPRAPEPPAPAEPPAVEERPTAEAPAPAPTPAPAPEPVPEPVAETPPAPPAEPPAPEPEAEAPAPPAPEPPAPVAQEPEAPAPVEEPAPAPVAEVEAPAPAADVEQPAAAQAEAPAPPVEPPPAPEKKPQERDEPRRPRVPIVSQPELRPGPAPRPPIRRNAPPVDLPPPSTPQRPESRPEGRPEGRPAPAPASSSGSDGPRPGQPVRSEEPGSRRPGGPVRPASPPPAGTRPGGGGPRGRRRRVVIDAQASRRGPAPQGRDRRGGPRPAQRDEREGANGVVAPADLPPVDVPSGATVKELGEALDVPTAQIIKLLMTLGEMATITQSLSDEALELVAGELERKVKIVHAEEEADLEPTFDDAPEDLVARAPVVVVMGHVDHGKTSLLDAVRETEVAAGEAGGITQHIGAYQAHHGDREITFLDTPGHEAFTAMRARGAKITDVAVIVVAADDGVMPQTVEAIDHARAADVPFMIAINKIDKPDANPDRVKQELTKYEIVPSEWGGQHEFVEVSALAKTGLDTLLETVLLVADADADPKANPEAEASGTVIESRLDPGRGPVCTLLVQRGTMKVGDVLLAGDAFGRVRAMTDFKGGALKEAGPSVPVEVLGLNDVPDAGEKFRVVDNERTARQMASERSHRVRVEQQANTRPVSLDDLFARIKEGGLKELNVIVKGDVQGSVGALVDALNKVEQTEVRLRVIHTGVGAITESDVDLAAASSAIVIGFNVRPRPEAKLLAERSGVDIRTYRVIYRVIDDVRDALVGLLEPETVEDVVGQLEVRATFRASRIGTIAGCYVTDGVIRRSSQVRLLRDGTVVHEGKIASLKRFNDDVREVAAGFECGLLIEDYNDVKEGDTVEAFETRQVARTSQAAAPAAAE